MPPLMSRRSTSFHVLSRESSGDGEHLSSSQSDKITTTSTALHRRRRRNKNKKNHLSQPSVDSGLDPCLLEGEVLGNGCMSAVSVSYTDGSVNPIVDGPYRQESFGSWDTMFSRSNSPDSTGLATCSSQFSPISHTVEESCANGIHSNGLQADRKEQPSSIKIKLDCMGNGVYACIDTMPVSVQHLTEGAHGKSNLQVPDSTIFVHRLSEQAEECDSLKRQDGCIGMVETLFSVPADVDYPSSEGLKIADMHTSSMVKEDLVSPGIITGVEMFVDDGSSAWTSQLSRAELRQRNMHGTPSELSKPVSHHADEPSIQIKELDEPSLNASEPGTRAENRDSYRTPDKPIHPSVMHTETPHLLDWEQLMSANSMCSQPAVTSPLEFFWGEVLRPASTTQDSQSAETDKKRQHVYNTMFHVPWRCELLIVVGFFVCLDSFLSLLTVMPVRIVVCLWRFLVKRRQFQRLRADELSDLGSLLVLMAGVFLLQQTDISYIYHMIRSQATIKLYVVYNVLEIFDKLCQSFGSDVLQVVLNSAENVATCPSTALVSETFRYVLDQCIAIISFVSHSFIILAQSITVSAAIRSHNNALLTLLISNNFAEIKSNVFKRLAKDNLHKLAYLDTVERFHIVAHLFFVLAQNLLAANEPWLHAFACNAGMVFACEVLVDVIKHAFLAKFNEIKPAAYSEFLLSLCKQTLNSQSREVHKTMSFVPFAPACVVIRVLIPLYAAYLPGGLFLRFLVMLLFGITTYAFLIALKILVALGLLKHASWYVARHKKKEKLLHYD